MPNCPLLFCGVQFAFFERGERERDKGEATQRTEAVARVACFFLLQSGVAQGGGGKTASVRVWTATMAPCRKSFCPWDACCTIGVDQRVRNSHVQNCMVGGRASSNNIGRTEAWDQGKR